MYGQGNFAPRFGQTPQMSVPPSQKHLRPHPPPPFQHGSTTPQSHMVQQGPPFFPALVGQSGSPMYSHFPVLPSGISNSGQSYSTPLPTLPPPPQVHRSTPIAHSFSSTQQNPQWTQNVHHISSSIHPPLGPPPTSQSGPEMLCPPPPPRVLSTPLSQGKALFRGPVHPPLPGGVQDIQHTPLPHPHPSSSILYTNAPFGPVVNPAPQDSQTPLVGLLPPPPPPSSPPGPAPLPPSSPPPTSPPACSRSPSDPLHSSSSYPDHFESGPTSNQHADVELIDSDSIDKSSVPLHTIDDFPNCEWGTGTEEGSMLKHGLSPLKNFNLDLPPSPLKPKEERVMRKIEVLCQYIARNGPGFEDMTRKVELGNPEFEFLFGGVPGSEAAVAHEYFLWMKKKCSLSHRLHEGKQHSDSSLRTFQLHRLHKEEQHNDSSSRPFQTESLMDAGLFQSPADSDMDMEDDITQINEEQKISEKLPEPHSVAEHSPAQDSVSRNLLCSVSSVFVEQGEDSYMAESSGAEGYDPSKDPTRKAKSKDPGWKYGFWPELSDKNLVQCILCGKRVHGGIKRFKQHLTGGYGDVVKCPRTTQEIANEMHQAIMSNKRNKPIQFDDSDEVEEIQSSNIPSNASNPSNASSATIPSSGTAAKRMKSAFQFTKPQPQTKTIETHLRKSPEEVVDERHRKGPSQTTLENRLRTPEEKDRVHMHIANWFYESGIPFNAANSRSFEVMIEAIGQHGSGLKPPSYHELRVPLLDKAKTKTEELKEKHKTSWKQYGCTLMSDGWTDRRGRHLINFLANSPEGTYFMGSVDASSQSQDASMLAELLDGKIKEIGVEHVVQVVTDNASNYKAAGHILMERRPTLFWTPCAAHCLDLMLEDIGNLKQFKCAIGRARKITTFIYRHGRLLDAMRSKTDGRDLVRPGVTRFATSFLTLQSLCKHKDALRHLFISDDWTHSRLSTTEAGKKVYDTVISSSFWHIVEDCIRASQPLLVVLRIVDSDERPAMPEVFAAMEFAKKKIKDAFNNKQRLYKKVIDIIERRWACQMEQKLYGAALFLNPGKYFDIKEEESDNAFRLRSNFNHVLSKMVPDQVLADKISNLADVYDSSRDDFASNMSIRQRKSKNPIDWWNAFGGCAIELAKFAKRIIGLCCSSSGCERNWSTFEFIHTKKRNRLEHQRLNDLVYVQYNRRIVSRFQKRRELGKNFDPLALDDFDWGNEWIMPEQDVVHHGDDLTWEDVDRAVGASDAAEGRNLPRTSHVYSRRGRGGISTLSEPRIRVVDDDDSDSDAREEEEGLPNDDEDVDDDYGQRVTTVSSDDTTAGRDDDDLILDDYA